MPRRPEIRHGHPQALYNPAADIVRLPAREDFHSPEAYYATLFHELVHATGHPSRLHRFESAKPSLRDVDAYGKEELVAEMGAAFLCGHARIAQDTVANAAAYIRPWLRRLREDQRLLVRAASHAQKAADYVTNQFTPSDHPLSSHGQG